VSNEVRLRNPQNTTGGGAGAELLSAGTAADAAAENNCVNKGGEISASKN
jgi:hypothetical protein